MENKYLKKISPEVINFLKQMKKSVNNNPLFIKMLESEIICALYTKGELEIKDNRLVGEYFSKSTPLARVSGIVRQTLTATLGNDKLESKIVVECPRDTYTWNDENSIFYGKQATDYYKKTTTYTKESQCIVKETKNMNIYMSPRVTYISDKDSKTLYEFDDDNEVSLSIKTVTPRQGYHHNEKGFIKFGEDLKNKETTKISKIGNYYIKDYVSETDEGNIRRVYMAPAVKSGDGSTITLWEEIGQLDYSVIEGKTMPPEAVYQKVLNDKKKN